MCGLQQANYWRCWKRNKYPANLYSRASAAELKDTVIPTAVAYDRDNDLLNVLELFADEARPVVRGWEVQ